MTETLQLETWQDEVRRLARKQDAVVLAHNYMPAPIQDVADVVGDSLALARHAAATDAATIVLCGVLFMAETAKILNPDKTVLVPTAEAGCSLADGITADDVRRWRAEHPGAVVVAYVNTTAAVKAEADLCCTSANAVEVVSLDPGGPAGAVLARPVPRRSRPADDGSRRTFTCGWASATSTPGISPDDVRRQVAAHPDAELLVHPECGCATSALWLAGQGDPARERTRVLSTGGMVEAARATDRRDRARRDRGRDAPPAPQGQVGHDVPADERAGVVPLHEDDARPELLLRCLREGRDEVIVEPATRRPRSRLRSRRCSTSANPEPG